MNNTSLIPGPKNCALWRVGGLGGLVVIPYWNNSFPGADLQGTHQAQAPLFLLVKFFRALYLPLCQFNNHHYANTSVQI